MGESSTVKEANDKKKELLKKGRVLVDWELEQLVDEGYVQGESIDKVNQISPASFDIRFSNELYVIDSETAGVFQNIEGKEVRSRLMELPRSQRPRFDITNGFDLKTGGYSYLIRVNERVKLPKDTKIRFSPKSSSGREFFDPQLIADFNPMYDWVLPEYNNSDSLELWMLISSPAFNHRVYPGTSLGQIRFHTGDPKMTISELKEREKEAPLVRLLKPGKTNLDDDDSYYPAPHVYTDGLVLHFDAEGKNNHRVVAFRAKRRYDKVIDLNYYGTPLEGYWEEVMAGERAQLHSGERYLFASYEFFNVPLDMCAEVARNSEIGGRGHKDKAGFVDNRFRRQLVFEYKPDSDDPINVIHKQPICTVDFFRTDTPKRPYGSNSNYHEQIGPRPAKWFVVPNFKRIAREHALLNEKVLVHRKDKLKSLRRLSSGYEPTNESIKEQLERLLENGFFHFRRDIEAKREKVKNEIIYTAGDEQVLQIIPYTLVFGENKTVFWYEREAELEKIGEEGLYGKESFGVSCHIQEKDGPDYLFNASRRSLDEELVVQKGHSDPVLMGSIVLEYDLGENYKLETLMNRCHMGFVMAVHAQGPVKAEHESIKQGRFIPLEDLTRISQDKLAKYEPWSQAVLPHIEAIYELSKPKPQ